MAVGHLPVKALPVAVPMPQRATNERCLRGSRSTVATTLWRWWKGFSVATGKEASADNTCRLNRFVGRTRERQAGVVHSDWDATGRLSVDIVEALRARVRLEAEAICLCAALSHRHIGTRGRARSGWPCCWRRGRSACLRFSRGAGRME